MPVIRPYTSTESAQAAPPSPRLSPSDFGGGAAALAGLGKTLIGYADEQTKLAGEREASDVTAKTLSTRADLELDLDKAYASAPAGDTSWHDSFVEAAQDRLSRIGENISTPQGRAAYERQSASTLAALRLRAGELQIRGVAAKARSDYMAGENSARALVARDPSQYESVRDELLHHVDNNLTFVPADARAALAARTRAELASTAVQSLIETRPAEAKKQIESGRFDGDLDEDHRFALVRAADERPGRSPTRT